MSASASFIRLFLGFLLGATGVHASCPIELSPPSVAVKYGDPVSIVCSSLVEGMGWEASQGGTGLEEVTQLTWTVPSLTEWTIDPKCFINPSDGSPYKECSKNAKVVIYTFPQNISISSSSGSNGTMKEMEEYKFLCEINHVAPVGKLNLRWYRGDQIIYSEAFENTTKEPVNPSSVLSFTPTRKDDGVTFRCEAHLDLGPEGPQLNVSSQEFNITVHFGPEIQCSSTIELLEGETLVERCPMAGNPSPLVRWLKDGQTIDPATPLSRENAGPYTIEAEGFTLLRKELLVHVLFGPELKCPSDYTALEYAPHNLTCTVKGYPKPETIWYKDGEKVELPENLTRSETGQYLITASNYLTSVNRTVEITVIYPPSKIVELEDSEVDVGATVWLKCSSSMGNPRPKYFWDYYRSANVMEENEDGVSLLTIHNATALNMGSYTCHAVNDRGNVSKTARLTVKGAKQECPIELTPDRMVIQYQGGSQKATCQPTSTSLGNAKEISWQVEHGVVTDSTSWTVDTHYWDQNPVCTGTFKGIGTCQKYLDFTLYKTPDSVSIQPVEDLSSVVEQREFRLQCDITNVAPAGKLVVRWYRGNDSIEVPVEGSLRVTGCLSENVTGCDARTIRSPVNVSSTISVNLNRKQNGAEFRCEAQLDLGPEGPQPSPITQSNPLNITVHYKPIINTTRLPKRIPVFRDYPEELVCEAEGYPTPEIQWLYSSDKVRHLSGNMIIVSEAGFYNCNATNEVGSVSFRVEVILKGQPAASVSCPIEMSPPSVVVRFGEPFSVNCSSSEPIEGMGWESTYRGISLTDGVSSLLLEIDSVKDWYIESKCFINALDGEQCLKKLPITVYKPPESVTLSVHNHTGTMVEGETYEMKCDVYNVAPAGRLSLDWLLPYTTPVQSVTESSLAPVNISSILNLTADRRYNGAKIGCEALLILGPTAPELGMDSNTLELIVLYPPTFAEPAHETLEVAAGSETVLNCTAAGNPTPLYAWHFPPTIKEKDKIWNEYQPLLTPSFPGTYNCTASNKLGTETKSFTVVEVKRDRTTFAALIGGFVSLGVLLIAAGLFFGTPEGTLSCSKGGYLIGRPTSSGIV